jgi:hypothetical protein
MLPAEVIVATVKTRLLGLAATSDHVFRGRVYPLQEAELPALFVYMGPDAPQAMYSQTLMDSLLAVNVEAVVKAANAELETLLNEIRRQAIVALQSDYTQGLAFVLNTDEGQADEPVFSSDGDRRSGTLKMQWQFLYRRHRTNPSA